MGVIIYLFFYYKMLQTTEVIAPIIFCFSKRLLNIRPRKFLTRPPCGKSMEQLNCNIIPFIFYLLIYTVTYSFYFLYIIYLLLLRVLINYEKTSITGQSEGPSMYILNSINRPLLQF